MPNFDGTIDNRWRPDLESSQRRVREEEQAEVVHSRELSFVPARCKSFEAYDAQTAALIRRVVELERLPHGEHVGRLLEEWRWIDKMKDACEKQRFLEPRIEAVRRDPHANEHLVIFLMLAFEAVRRSVSKAFVDALGPGTAVARRELEQPRGGADDLAHRARVPLRRHEGGGA